MSLQDVLTSLRAVVICSTRARQGAVALAPWAAQAKKASARLTILRAHIKAIRVAETATAARSMVDRLARALEETQRTTGREHERAIEALALAIDHARKELLAQNAIGVSGAARS